VVEPPESPLSGDWLTTRQAANLLGITEGTLRGYISRGRFPDADSYVGNTRLWKRVTVEHWATQRPRKGKPTT
jgi:excisionase family DNA binding protein